MAAGVLVGRGFALLGSCSGLTAHLIDRNAPTTKLLALGKEAFACVTFHKQGLVFVTQLVPEIVEIGIMRPEDDMR